MSVRQIVSQGVLLCTALAVGLGAQADGGAEPPPIQSQTQSPAQAMGHQRIPWTTSRLIGFPQAPLPYRTERVFPNLKFKSPVDLCTAPASDRLFILELGGKIYSFPVETNNQQVDLFLDLTREIPGLDMAYGLAFHPQYQSNHFVYVAYALKPGIADGSRVVRFKAIQSDPPRVDPASGTNLITWLSGGHNGECLKFGPDGCLYISTGDGAGPDPPDRLNTGQDISDLLSSILRIDVDHSQAGKPYRVPADNPFVKTPGARPEVWAYGLRNPFKMSFDQAGQLWVGDVGYEKWELIHLVQAGGNYGWSVVEGRQSIKPGTQRGPAPISPPIVDHPHSEGSCIIGGQVYYGSRLPVLKGAYIYGDYATSRIWGLRYDGARLTWHQLLANSGVNLISFAEDHSGELYILEYGGTIQRLVLNPDTQRNDKFPRKLSETGLFSSVATHAPAPGVIPYAINAEPWSDFAQAERFIALPGTNQINNTGPWSFPKEAVLAKTFSLEMERGQPASRKRLETQILHLDRGLWRGYSFRWNAEQTDALLVDEDGADQRLEVKDNEAPGGRRPQTWHFPSRSECMRCHNPYAGAVLGFNLPQLDRTNWCEEAGEIQLQRLGQIGLFNKLIDPGIAKRLPNPCDPAAPLQERARAYLHVNCAHCHRETSGGAVAARMGWELKLEETKMLDVNPTQGAFGIPEARVIVPGDPLRSVLYYRISKTGPGRMPFLGSSLVDVAGVNLIYDWIEQMPRQSGPSSLETSLSSGQTHHQTFIAQLRSGVITNGVQSRLIDRWLSNTSEALFLSNELNRKPFPPHVQREILEKASTCSDGFVSDLFEHFLPEENRTRRLGATIDAERILALKGDADQGKKSFFQEGGAQCFRCHRIYSQGMNFGPELSHIGQKYNRAQLLESILNPSRAIAPEFVSYQVETTAGLSYSGFILRRSDSEILLKDATCREISIPANQISQLTPQTLSAMPELLLQGMTPQGVADLLEYLASLR